LGEEGRVHDLGVVAVDQAVDDLVGGAADLAVQLGDLCGQPLALGGGLVHVGRGERGERLVEKRLDVLGSEHPPLDGLQHQGVQLLHPHRDAGAGGGVVLPDGAVVEEGPCARPAAGDDVDAPAAGTELEPGRQQPPRAGADRVRAVAQPGLASAVAQGALGPDALEGGVVHRGLVAVPRDDLAVEHDVSAVDGIGEWVRDVPRPLHILPDGFHKIRHFGLYSSTAVRERLSAAAAALGQRRPAPQPDATTPAIEVEDVVRDLTGVDLRRCPCCEIGRMLRFLVPPQPSKIGPRPRDTS